MYGQTEASPRMSYLDWKNAKKRIGSIGKPIPGGKFYIYNEKNKIIKKNNAVGELIYEGNNVMLGYAEKIEDLKKENFNNNKLFTGDFAKRDKDGFYYITGRKNRYLKMFGLRINLDEVEQQIKSQNIDSACLGKDTPPLGPTVLTPRRCAADRCVAHSEHPATGSSRAPPRTRRAHRLRR